jgi:hypothetical protein
MIVSGTYLQRDWVSGEEEYGRFKSINGSRDLTGRV